MGYWDVDYSQLDFIKKMRGDDVDVVSTKEEVKELTADYTDEEILDYIIVFICQRLKSVKSAFKGGYTLMKILPEVARLSHDIDFSISDVEQYELVKSVLDELGTALISLNIISNYEIKQTITETSSGGIKLRRDRKVDLGIDIGLHNLSYGIQSWNIFGQEVERFIIERMLADKISAIFSRKRFRRSKDLYDLYILTESCDINIDVLRECLNERSIDWNATPFDSIVQVEYAKAYNQLSVKNHLGTALPLPEFSDCMLSLHDILVKLGVNYDTTRY